MSACGENDPERIKTKAILLKFVTAQDAQLLG